MSIDYFGFIKIKYAMLNYHFLVRMENLCKMSNYNIVSHILAKMFQFILFALHTRERKVSRAHLCKVVL
jgi:hypothetical protein